MSEDAKTLMYWIEQARTSVADNDQDRAYCLNCARKWAATLLTN